MSQSSTLLPSAMRRGLTLLELLVVLTILIALGGIVIATLPGLLDRAQSATAAANVPEIDAAIKRELVVHQGQIGNRFDSLITGNSSITGSIPRYVGGSEIFQAVSLDDSELRALAQLGVTELIPASETADNATFDSHDQPPVALSGESKVCAISNAFAPELLKDMWNVTTPAEARYLVFGLGEQCSLVGAGTSAVFAEAPVHFSDNSVSSPKNMYCRYLIVVELLTRDERESTARYVGTAIPHLSGMQGVKSELENFYSGQ